MINGEPEITLYILNITTHKYFQPAIHSESKCMVEGETQQCYFLLLNYRVIYKKGEKVNSVGYCLPVA